MTEYYDGFYFLPNNKDSALFNFFTFDEDDGDLANSKKVDSKNEVGDFFDLIFILI